MFPATCERLDQSRTIRDVLPRCPEVEAVPKRQSLHLHSLETSAVVRALRVI